MDTNMIIYIVIFFAVVYAGGFYWWKLQRSKSQNAFANLDLRREAASAPQYQHNLLGGEYAFLQVQMADKPVDVFTTAASEYTTKDQLKSAGKDALKGLATLGTVKFTTVTTPKYLVLSGEELHVFDTDKEGHIDRHLVFDRSRLKNSTITELPQPESSWKQVKYGDYLLKSYRLELSTGLGEKPVTLIVYNGVVNVSAASNAAFLSMNAAKQVQDFVAGNYFLNKLGEKHANLKVGTYLPTA